MAKDAMVESSWMNFMLLVVVVECDVVAAAACLRLASCVLRLVCLYTDCMLCIQFDFMSTRGECNR
jgi:hypothetical protein